MIRAVLAASRSLIAAVLGRFRQPAPAVANVPGATPRMPDEEAPPEQLYTPAWFEELIWTNEWSNRALAALFDHLGRPGSMLDVGCGDGHVVRFAASMGIAAVGVDIAIGDEEGDSYRLLRRDLRLALDLSQSFDLVISWEVGEHLPESSADIFCDSLVRHMTPAGWLAFTAAIPSQTGGTGHINMQPHSYWREKLVARGLLYEDEMTEAVRSSWQAVTGPCYWYPQNIQVFRAQP